MTDIRRRQLLSLAGGLTLAGLAGCLGDDGADDDADRPSLQIVVTNERDASVEFELVIAEEGVDFDDAEVLTAAALSVPGDEYRLGPMYDYEDGPYRFGLSVDGGEWHQLRHRWRLNECHDLELHLRLRQQEHALVVSCRPPPRSV